MSEMCENGKRNILSVTSNNIENTIEVKNVEVQNLKIILKSESRNTVTMKI